MFEKLGVETRTSAANLAMSKAIIFSTYGSPAPMLSFSEYRDYVMAVLVTLLFLLALWVWAFVVWERKRQPPTVSREALTEGWSPRSILK